LLPEPKVLLFWTFQLAVFTLEPSKSSLKMAFHVAPPVTPTGG
jgi:hypothetical protein